MHRHFPVLGLEQVYGAITYYLAHREELDRYLAARETDFEVKRRAARDADPMFYQKLADAKKQTPRLPADLTMSDSRRGSQAVVRLRSTCLSGRAADD